MKVLIDHNGKPLKLWVEGVPVEEEALDQLRQTAQLPFIYKWIAGMPDIHKGKGSTVGSVIATSGALVPATVGVDLGCGMLAYKLPIHASDLPDSLSALRDIIERAVPHGRDKDGGQSDKGTWNLSERTPERVRMNGQRFMDALKVVRSSSGRLLVDEHPGILPRSVDNIIAQMGTLGTGNHFIELCVDESDGVWVMLHSGSRGAGNRIGSYFIEQAKLQAERYGYAGYLPHMDLAWLNEDTPIFEDYVSAITWAQNYAMANRLVMLRQVLDAIGFILGRLVLNIPNDLVINCHHNYAVKEHHYGKNVWVTRKGAVRAREGDLGIIPGSMGAKSFIVRGKGNPESFMSCSHGAGRRMSRTAAKRAFTLEDHERDTAGVECRKDRDVLDETPQAYKDIDAVIAAENDLIEVVYTLKQVLCVKG